MARTALSDRTNAMYHGQPSVAKVGKMPHLEPTMQAGAGCQQQGARLDHRDLRLAAVGTLSPTEYRHDPYASAGTSPTDPFNSSFVSYGEPEPVPPPPSLLPNMVYTNGSHPATRSPSQPTSPWTARLENSPSMGEMSLSGSYYLPQSGYCREAIPQHASPAPVSPAQPMYDSSNSHTRPLPHLQPLHPQTLITSPPHTPEDRHSHANHASIQRRSVQRQMPLPLSPSFAREPRATLPSPQAVADRPQYEPGPAFEGPTIKGVALIEFRFGRCDEYVTKFACKVGDRVIVGGDRGYDLGRVKVWTPDDGTRSKDVSPDRKAYRPATDQDILDYERMQDMEATVTEEANDIILRAGLRMRIVNSEFQYDKAKLTLHYTSPDARTDWRPVLNDLFKYVRTRFLSCAVHSTH
ncbi:hypothetical protein DIPPA_15377 [Diplonema papillatum]|nr:hypothetical protein DIPPA_15377 [Diplonema papillatum]